MNPKKKTYLPCVPLNSVTYVQPGLNTSWIKNGCLALPFHQFLFKLWNNYIAIYSKWKWKSTQGNPLEKHLWVRHSLCLNSPLISNSLYKADKNLVQNNTSKLFTLLGSEFFFNYSNSVCTSLSNTYNWINCINFQQQIYVINCVKPFMIWMSLLMIK